MQELTKRLRGFSLDEDELTKRKSKSNKHNNTTAFDFQCSAFYQGQFISFHLLDVFQNVNYALIFFCSYDFTEQSKSDLLQIQQYFSSFIEKGVLPVVITQDSVYTHKLYATPGQTSFSLGFKPSYILASDFADRLISIAYKAMNMNTRDIKRTAVIVRNDMEVLFHYHVPEGRNFPVDILLDCFGEHL
ncbi:hypothetical protein BDF20DRAFT_435069 [Mycotypha africana]|uniref:uncharacterized protein n=1 Tax=Mycotypha africana TaxID=64632 RepID=UPI0023007AF0|nr:uncharacterized protein BDF20DRAFT_435069 [Mycotypha africana]KAI8981890.1 hypothetical protein BDF20DRAFT_435069 [Mycotypha africana]